MRSVSYVIVIIPVTRVDKEAHVQFACLTSAPFHHPQTAPFTSLLLFLQERLCLRGSWKGLPETAQLHHRRRLILKLFGATFLDDERNELKCGQNFVRSVNFP